MKSSSRMTRAAQWRCRVAVILVLGTLTTACSQFILANPAKPLALAEGTRAPGLARLKDVKITLRVGTGDSGDGLRPHHEIIARFEQANPDIRVEVESVAGNDYYAQLMAQVAAGNAPDIMQIGDDAVPMFVQKGALTELGPFVKGQYPLDPSIYLPGVFLPGEWRGGQYLLPKDYSPLAVYYNKRLFDQYRVAYPKDGWTWDEFLKTAQALTAIQMATASQKCGASNCPPHGRAVLNTGPRQPEAAW